MLESVSLRGTTIALLPTETFGFMLRITKQERSGRVVLKLEGRFSAAWVNELEACWRAARDGAEDESIWLDLSDVHLVDVAGQEQLTRMYRAGVRFVTRDCVMRELVREISESY